MSRQTQSRVKAAAQALVASRLGGGQLEHLPAELRPSKQADAYRVQQAGHTLLSDAGFGARAGWKIGCTSRAMQSYLGVDHPCSGGMFDANIWHHSHALVLHPPRRFGAECELAVRMGKDLNDRKGGYSSTDLVNAIQACMIAIEVVEDRYVDFRSLDVQTLIADDFFHYGCILGNEIDGFDPRLLRIVAATMEINGVRIGTAAGSELLGDPLEALAWLVNNSIRHGLRIQAGDVVMLGSLIPTEWITKASRVRVTSKELGEVGVVFATPGSESDTD